MTGSKLMKAALAAGRHDDATIAAALDVLREEDGCTLLSAVLEVARIHQAMHDSRDIAAAHEQLAPASPIRAALRRAIVDECLDLQPGIEAMVVVVPGDRCPTASRSTPQLLVDAANMPIVSVGAIWVKRVASRLQLIREREARRPRRRRSN